MSAVGIEDGQKKQHTASSHEKLAHTTVKQQWPVSLRQQLIGTFKQPPNEKQARAFLADHYWPDGLISTLVKDCKKIPMHFFIVDDSGSMIIEDGKKIIKYGFNKAKMTKCTRWAELTESMIFLAELSEALLVPCEFRLLNGADPIVVGLGDDKGESFSFMKDVMEDTPAGTTPLCAQINAVVQSISSIAEALRKNNQKVTVMIATDGESSDGNVADALRPLTDLPVLVVLRLCTSEKTVVDYWNNIDQQLELDIDVLDNQQDEALQINGHNSWMVYGEALHRLREFGVSIKEMDVIDQSTLNSEQMHMMCHYLFVGKGSNEIPHPSVDWHAFSTRIAELTAAGPMAYDPVSNSMRPWVNMSRLHKMFKAESSGTSSCLIM